MEFSFGAFQFASNFETLWEGLSALVSSSIESEETFFLDDGR